VADRRLFSDFDCGVWSYIRFILTFNPLTLFDILAILQISNYSLFVDGILFENVKNNKSYHQHNIILPNLTYWHYACAFYRYM
jgi:hypothetical protein